MRSNAPVVYQLVRGGTVEKAEFSAARIPQVFLFSTALFSHTIFTVTRKKNYFSHVLGCPFIYICKMR